MLAAESRALKHRLSSKETEITKLHTRVAELTKAVATASKEQQVLQAKLSVQVPGSAVKPGRGPLVGIGGAAGADQQWVQRVKEELYGDLTNLMIVSVKKESESRLFECLQTGANGGSMFPPTPSPPLFC